jgi:hypothetical protein
MLKNNIYFLFPAGYMGNYLQWIINRSEQHSASQTIDNPLLTDGTTHGFIRTPTHLGINRLLIWKARNQPRGYKTYILNCFDSKENYESRSGYAADIIFRSDPTALIINIHAADENQIKLGALNTYTKWPVFFKSSQFTPTDKWYNFTYNVDQATLTDRNWFFNNWRNRFPINNLFNFDEFNYNVTGNKKWFIKRHAQSPWEITEEQYEKYDHVPIDRIIDISIGNILSNNFIEYFSKIIDNQQVGAFDWDNATTFHQTYISAQHNLKLLPALKCLQEENKASTFMFDNYFTECLLLEEINNLNECLAWESMTTVEICKYFNIMLSAEFI